MTPPADANTRNTPAHLEAPRQLENLHRREMVSEAGHEVLELDLRVPENLVYFQGHFHGDPVLPGVVQLSEVALTAIELQWPDLGRLGRVRRLKFIQTIRPGDVMRLRVERKSSTSVSLVITKDDSSCTSAVLLFEKRG